LPIDMLKDVEEGRHDAAARARPPRSPWRTRR
jgi:hypothetical protein